MSYTKIFKACFLILATSILILNIQGCGKKDSKLPTESGTTIDLYKKAESALEKKDYQEAERLYNEVLKTEPNNPEALFGSSMASLINLRHNQKVKDLEEDINGPGKNLITARDNFAATAGKTMASFVMTAVKDPILASDIQNILDNDIIPALDGVLGKLKIIEDSGSFNYIAKKEIYDTASDYEIDLADIYALDSSINIIRAILSLLVSYNLDLADYEAAAKDPLSIITPTSANYVPTFLTLRSAFRIAQFRENILTAIEKAKKSVETMYAETDPQEDDIIKKPNIKEKEEMLADLEEAKKWLHNPVVEKVKDKSGQTIEVTIDLKQLFINPLGDIKRYLPPLEYGDPTNKSHIRAKKDKAGNIDFPDPTFKGFLPNMTKEKLSSIDF